MKREGASTLFIHGYPWALSYLFLDHLPLFFNCLKWCFVCVVFENVLKKMHCLGNHCNNSLLECFTKVFVFLKRCFNVFLKVVLKLCGDVCLKNGKDVLQVFDQVTKSHLP